LTTVYRRECTTADFKVLGMDMKSDWVGFVGGEKDDVCVFVVDCSWAASDAIVRTGVNRGLASA
jgi:hypothetical protein